MSAPLERIAVVGGGLMGVGVAQVFAAAGHEVTLQDVYDEALVSASPGCAPCQSVVPCRARLFPADGVRGRRRPGPDHQRHGRRRRGRRRVVEVASSRTSPSSRASSSGRRRLPVGDDPLHQHVGHEHHRDRREDGCTRCAWSAPLLEPAVPHPVGRGRPHRGRRAGRGGPHHGPAPARGQAPPHRLQEDVPGCVANRPAAPLWREAILGSWSTASRRRGDRGREHPLRARPCACDPGGPMENADMVGLDLTLAIPQLHPAAPRWPRARRLRCSRRRWAQATSASRAARGSSTGRRESAEARASGWSPTWSSSSQSRSAGSEREVLAGGI